MGMQTVTADDSINPLDHVEEILNHNNWIYNRTNDQELSVKISGKSCDYNIFFIWQQNMNALQFCAQYDLTVHCKNLSAASLALMDMNTLLWMGHFEISRDTLAPSFRHVCLLRGGERSNHDSIQDIVDIALVQCERFRYVFDLLSHEENVTADSLSLAMMETLGES